MELLCGGVVDVGDDGLELADAAASGLARHLDELPGERGAVERRNVLPHGGAPLRPHRQAVLAVALEGERDARVVDGVLGDDVGHARELVRAGPEDLAPRRHVVEEVLHRDLRALGFGSRVK